MTRLKFYVALLVTGPAPPIISTIRQKLGTIAYMTAGAFDIVFRFEADDDNDLYERIKAVLIPHSQSINYSPTFRIKREWEKKTDASVSAFVFMKVGEHIQENMIDAIAREVPQANRICNVDGRDFNLVVEVANTTPRNSDTIVNRLDKIPEVMRIVTMFILGPT